MNNRYTIGQINQKTKHPADFLAECSAAYKEKTDAVAKKVFSDKTKKIVMLAGPSSSGKTTTAKILSRGISTLGGKAYTVSLDDFYHPRSVGYPLDENGKPDYECVEALDIELLNSKLRELSDYGKSAFPVFDFKTGERINDAKTIELSENDVIILEGLHALNPIITDCLPADRLLKMYINVSSRIYDKDNNIILNKRNMRFIRRMVRDYKFRGNSVEKTYELWLNVQYGEDMYLFPFKDNADIKINI